jgi:hypothetical protein
MLTTQRSTWKMGTGQSLVTVLFLLSLLLTLSACGNTSLQQQASQEKVQLDNLLHHALAIGVPVTLLQPVQRQEQQLAQSRAPFSLFNTQPIDDYYRNLTTRYRQLLIQTQGIIDTTIQQDQALAQNALQEFHTALLRQQSNHLPVQQFAQQFSQQQQALAHATTPLQYNAINQQATTATQALDLLQNDAALLTTFHTTIQQMQQASLDVTAMQMQYQSDQQLLARGRLPADFLQLQTLLNAQYLQAVVTSRAALPFVMNAKLKELVTQVNRLKTYGISASTVSTYQQQVQTAQQMMTSTRTLSEYQQFAHLVDQALSSMQELLAQGEAAYLVNQFHQEVTSWGQAHEYHDSFNNTNYVLDAGYMSQGIGSDLDAALSYAQTPADLQNVVDEAQNALFNLHMMEQDYSDKTPYNQVHATDLQMLAHYNLQNQQVLMISLVEQAMRVYQNGKLVNAFQVTTGRNELPSLPGVWPTLERLSPTTFISPDPPGSPYWYPNTPINYAILYHTGGYFVHDAWWRVNFGPGTQFPHYDTGGDESFAGDGSHGCINMQEDQAAWVYSHTNWNTIIVIY